MREKAFDHADSKQCFMQRSYTFTGKNQLFSCYIHFNWFPSGFVTTYKQFSKYVLYNKNIIPNSFNWKER